MRRSLFFLLLSLATMSMAQSCSIRQERDGCPCWIDLLLAGGAEERVTVSFLDHGGEFRRTVSKTEEPEQFELQVPRSNYLLAAFCGLERCLVSQDSFTIPAGSEMDELYAGTTELDARGETASASVTLEKQFARVHLTFAASKGEVLPYRVVIRGRVKGFGIPGLQPIPGEFMYTINPVIGTYYVVRVPRQLDSSLMLEFTDIDATRGDDDSFTGEFPLGKAIEASGYDWTERDLKDIYMDLDYAQSGLHINVIEWREGDEMESEI